MSAELPHNKCRVVPCRSGNVMFVFVRSIELTIRSTIEPVHEIQAGRASAERATPTRPHAKAGLPACTEAGREAIDSHHNEARERS